MVRNGPEIKASPVNSKRQFSGFVLVGGFAALVNWGSRLAFSMGGMSLTWAVVCGYVCGMVTAYGLSRRYVFEKSGRSMVDEVWRFTLVNGVALLQVWAVTIVLSKWGLPLVGWTWHPESVAHAAGVASPVFTSYLGHRYITFGKASDSKKGAARPSGEP